MATSGAFVEAVSILVEAAGDATLQVRSAMLQQMTDSGLLQCLDVLAAATAQQLQEALSSSAEPAGDSGTSERAAASLELMQYATAALLRTQVGWCLLEPVRQQLGTCGAAAAGYGLVSAHAVSQQPLPSPADAVCLVHPLPLYSTALDAAHLSLG
jgi:hypothetical protein